VGNWYTDLREIAAGPWKQMKVREATYKKIIMMKATFEQLEQEPVTVGETIDTVFLAACEDLAKTTGKKLPEELYLHAKKRR
jgi:hypothetical protein